MIKTIIFDLGKTLVPFDFSRGYRAMEKYCGLGEKELRARIGSTDLVERFETGMVAPRDFVEQLCRQIEYCFDYDQFCEIWSSIFLRETLVPERLVEALKRRYRLLLLSNTNAIHFEMILGNYPILRFFDDFILSYEVKVLKPSPAIYRETVARAGCRPQECFFTDDIPAYIEAARREGIDAVQFESCEQLQREMSARGIVW